MPSLIDIRRRIRVVKNTQQITKAMKMVSAAKLRRAQERVIASRPYAEMMRRFSSNIAAAAAVERGSERRHPLLRSAKKTHPGDRRHQRIAVCAAPSMETFCMAATALYSRAHRGSRDSTSKVSAARPVISSAARTSITGRHIGGHDSSKPSTKARGDRREEMIDLYHESGVRRRLNRRQRVQDRSMAQRTVETIASGGSSRKAARSRSITSTSNGRKDTA